MHMRLCFGQTPEDAAGFSLDRFRQSTAGYHGVDPGIVSVGVVVVHLHIELERWQVLPFGMTDGEYVGIVA